MARIKLPSNRLKRLFGRGYIWSAVALIGGLSAGVAKIVPYEEPQNPDLIAATQEVRLAQTEINQIVASSTRSASTMPFGVTTQAMKDIELRLNSLISHKSRSWRLPDYLVFVGCCMTFFGGLVGLYVQLNADNRRDSPHELEGALYALWAVLTEGNSGTNNDPRVRITIHVPVKGSDGVTILRQLVDYVGDDRKKKTAGRTFSTKAGVIGVALEHEIGVGSWTGNNRNKFLKELQEKWHYSAQEANSLDPACRSWIAVAIPGEDDFVEAILYADAVKPNYFCMRRREMVENAIIGVAKFLDRKYNKT